ncbi:hypothetical protein L0128_09640 [candidate division KSB1 bacterium]|nr:hypothetical protein [candidate division KSB1 bacterium]
MMAGKQSRDSIPVIVAGYHLETIRSLLPRPEMLSVQWSMAVPADAF